MIPRYTRPEMGRIWSEEHKIELWLRVEIAVAEAWAEAGVVPSEALERIRGARCDLARMREIEAEVDHDVIAFIRATVESIGEEAGRFSTWASRVPTSSIRRWRCNWWKPVTSSWLIWRRSWMWSASRRCVIAGRS